MARDERLEQIKSQLKKAIVLLINEGTIKKHEDISSKEFRNQLTEKWCNLLTDYREEITQLENDFAIDRIEFIGVLLEKIDLQKCYAWHDKTQKKALQQLSDEINNGIHDTEIKQQMSEQDAEE